MKPQEIEQVIEEKIVEFRVALDSKKSNKDIISLYWQIKRLKSSLSQLN